MITHVAVESADQHDANALLPAIEDLQECDMAPVELLAGSLYGSDNNCEQVKQEQGVNVIAPAMPGNQTNMHLADFVLEDQGRITSCPKGVAPDTVKKTKHVFCAAFPATTCLKCGDLIAAPWAREGMPVITDTRIKISALPAEGSTKIVPTSKKNIATEPEWKQPCRNTTDEPESSTFEFEA